MAAKKVNEEDEFGELCAEILENWNSPICPDLGHQNPFSLHHHQFNPSYHTQTDVSIPNNEGTTHDFELEHDEHKIMNAPLITTDYEKEEDEKINDDAVIPQLVADTFYDMLLGHGLDGIDVATSNMVEESKSSDESEDDFRIILNQNYSVPTKNGIEMEKLHSGHEISSGLKCNFLTHEEYPISGENSCMPATSDSAPANCSARLVSKLNFKLPSNKTIIDINIDDFGLKLWRNPGVDTSDFFNYGLDEKQWKDYCKLMRAQVQAGSSGQSVVTTDKSKQSHKEGATYKVKLDKGIHECLNCTNSKDLSVYDSDVIIEIAMHDCVYEKAQPISHSRNTPHVKYRMINGDKILPFPMDSYSAEDRDKRPWRKEQSKKTDYANLKKPLTDFCEYNEMGGQQRYSSKKVIDYSLHQENQKRVRLNQGHQTSHHKLDINSPKSLCSSTREKMENYVSEGVKKNSTGGVFFPNVHNSENEMEVDGLVGNNIEEDPEKLKKRSERFKIPLPILKNAVANKSMEWATNFPPQQGMATKDLDIKDQHPTRRRKWTNS